MIKDLDFVILGVMILLVLLTLLIGWYPSLIAGYESDELPKDDESQLITDVRVVLVGCVISLFPMLVRESFDFINSSSATAFSVIVPVVLVIWLLIKYNGLLQ